MTVRVRIRRLENGCRWLLVFQLQLVLRRFEVCGEPVCDGVEADAMLPEGFGVCFFESEGINTGKLQTLQVCVHEGQ